MAHSPLSIRWIRINPNIEELVKSTRSQECWVNKIRAIACPNYKQVLVKQNENKKSKFRLGAEQKKRSYLKIAKTYIVMIYKEAKGTWVESLRPSISASI